MYRIIKIIGYTIVAAIVLAVSLILSILFQDVLEGYELHVPLLPIFGVVAGVMFAIVAEVRK